MIITRRICDRCGDEIPASGYLVAELNGIYNGERGRDPVFSCDLCEACGSSFGAAVRAFLSSPREWKVPKEVCLDGNPSPGAIHEHGEGADPSDSDSKPDICEETAETDEEPDGTEAPEEPSDMEGSQKLTFTQKNMICAIESFNGRGATALQVAKSIRHTEGFARKALEKLEKMGVVERDGDVYRLTEAV